MLAKNLYSQVGTEVSGSAQGKQLYYIYPLPPNKGIALYKNTAYLKSSVVLNRRYHVSY